ncbi:hypothetical protein BC2926_41240 [Bacillus cereus]|nr:hypothetical protein BC2926_41240 [Bacillus cereus]
MYFNGFNLLYVFYAIIEQVLLKIKKRHLKVPFFDLITTVYVSDFNPILVYHAMILCLLRNMSYINNK